VSSFENPSESDEGTLISKIETTRSLAAGGFETQAKPG
jgi:hypothetical protein